MSRMHILEQSSHNTFRVVVHAPTPTGNNDAGVSWKAALTNSGLAVTSMTTGVGPGQISVAEANQVTTGDLIEASFTWQDDPTWNPAQRTADLNTRAGQAAAEVTAQFQARLRRFGQEVA